MFFKNHYFELLSSEKVTYKFCRTNNILSIVLICLLFFLQITSHAEFEAQRQTIYLYFEFPIPKIKFASFSFLVHHYLCFKSHNPNIMPKKFLPSSNSRLLVIKRVISLSPNVTLWHGKDLRYQCFIEMQYIIASFSHNH